MKNLFKKWHFVVLLAATFSPPLMASSIRGNSDTNKIKDQYIVVLKEPVGLLAEDRAAFVDENVDRLTRDLEESILFKYHATIAGFAIHTANHKEIRRISRDPQVAFIEVDRPVRLFDSESTSQSNPPWGLDRIDARKGLDHIYHYATTASNVNAYIIDTGVRGTHHEFTGRIGQGFSSIEGGDPYEDCHGHGTHVTGTIGGSTYGIAKKVTIHAVRVMDCQGQGTDSGVIAGIDWVAQNAVKPAVANMSLGGEKSESLDTAVSRAIDTGVVFVVAGGNDNANACDNSPADVPNAITVGATTNSDARASYSNYGKCLKIFAPGSNIKSSWGTGDTATNTISGTSMASPHVAGAVALFLAQNPEADVATITKTVLNLATPDAISNVGQDSPNLFLYTNPNGDATPAK